MLKIPLPSNKKLLENFFSLSLLQGIVYLINFITFPYLVRILGPEKFGVVIFAQVFLNYFIIVTDYGFNLTGTRDISINRHKPDKISEFFSTILIIKVMFMLISGIILFFIILLIPKFRGEWLVYSLGFGMVIGNVFFPVWLFQGLEEMKYITAVNVVSKTIFALSIFILIREPSHYPYVLGLHSLGFVTGGLLSLWLARKRFNVRLSWPTRELIVSQVKKGWYMFISNISINLYKTSDLFILGLLASERLVGFYAISKKLIEVSNQFAVIISQTIYPHISKQIRESYSESMKFIRKVGILTLATTFTMGAVFFIFSELIVRLLAGEAYAESVLVLRILSITPFIVGMGVPPTQILLGSSLDRSFSKVMVSAEILSLILNILLIYWFMHIGAAISVILVEITVIGLLFYQVTKKIGKIKFLSQS